MIVSRMMCFVMQEDLYEKARKRAKELGLSMSAYVRHLISKDVNYLRELDELSDSDE